MRNISKLLTATATKHTLVLASAKAEIRRESDNKLFRAISEKPGEDMQAFTERIVKEARNIENALEEPCLIHIGGVSFQLGKGGKLKPSNKRLGRIEDNKLMREI